MKATFFSLATLAVSAVYAAPSPVSSDVEKRQASDAVGGLDNLLGEGGLGLDQVGDLLSGGNNGGDAAGDAAEGASDIADTGALIELLEGLLGNVQGNTGALDDIISQVDDGSITQEEGQAQAIPELENIQFQLTEIVTSITGAAGLTVRDGDVDRVLNLVVTLLSVVLATVNQLVTILGITPQLNTLLASVFSLLTGLLTALIGLLSGLLPGLVAALSPLLAGLGNGLLAPLLTPIVGLVAAIAPPLPA